jgi:four helix bundle protein
MHHENTRIHAKSIELIRLCAQAIATLPQGHADLANQLKRASSSIALNFAEGCGRTSPKDRVRFFTIARGSAKEVAMIFDVAHAFGAIDEPTTAAGKALCDHLGGMLFKYR